MSSTTPAALPDPEGDQRWLDMVRTIFVKRGIIVEFTFPLFFCFSIPGFVQRPERLNLTFYGLEAPLFKI